MRKLLLFTVTILFFNVVKAQKPADQNVLKGKITDSVSLSVLEYATISLSTKGSEKPLNGTVTDKMGRYILKNIPDGIYNINFEFIGYHTIVLKDINFSKNNIAEINIALIAKKTDLQGVVIIAQQKLVENKIDKIIFNAEKDITSQSGVATDVLKKVPQVSVDADGNVQLAGSGGVRFLINGKPSTAFGSNINDVLQSIPASQIKSIEVITNPGAKYDAQGMGGIINIILKANNAKGYNGNVSLTAGTRTENGSVNLNMRNNNFGVNAFFSGNARLRSTTPSKSDRLTSNGTTTSLLQQYGSGSFIRHGIQRGGGFDWTIKKLTSITGNISFNNYGFSSNGFTDQSILLDKNSNQPPLLTLLNNSQRYNFNNTDAGLNYKRNFAKEDQELNVGLNYSIENEKGYANSDQFHLPQDSLFYGAHSYNPGKTKEINLNIDYSQPIKKDIILGFGTKGVFTDIKSLSAVLQYQPVSQDYQPSASLSNNLEYKQNVYAAYAELSFPVSTLFNAKLGGRYERTEINSYYSNAQVQAKVPGYNTFVPSVFFSRKLGESQTLKLSYSKRIERPGYDDLNPFVNTSDPKNLSTGNSNLKPEIGYRYELGYNRDFGKIGSIMVNLFYRRNKNDIQPYIIYYPTYTVGDNTYTNVAVSTRQNIGEEQNLGINLFGDLHPNTKFNIRSNVFLFRRHTINVLDAGYNNNSFNYRFNINTSYQFTGNLVAEFFGNFNSARNEAQGRYPSFTTYSFAVRRQFLKKKASIALNANNFFNNYVNQKTNLFGPSFSVVSQRQIPFRSISLNFAWKFGKLDFKNEKKEPEQNNAASPE